MKRFLPVWIYLLLIAGDLCAQSNREIDVMGGAWPGVATFNYGDALVGTPFLLEEWSAGSITVVESIRYINQKIKYDVYKDELLVQNPTNSDIHLVPKKMVRSFSIKTTDADSLLFLNIKEDYYQVLRQGKASLLARHQKYMIKADKAGAGFNIKATDELKSNKLKYFLMQEGQSLKILKGNAKSVVGQFPDNWKELRQFINQEALKFKEAEDFIKLIDFYNEVN